MKCEHGCGLEAKVFKKPSRKVKSGRWQCAIHHLSCPAVMGRRRKTNMAIYGEDNPLKVFNADVSADKKQKVVNANIKRMDTFEKRYGVRGQFGVKETFTKAKITMIERYGVDNPMKVDKCKLKANETFERKYGKLTRGRNQFRKSKIGDEWLDTHGVNLREIWIRIADRRFKVDGMSDDLTTIYEFYGSYWHGDPRIYDAAFVNVQAHKTMGDLYLGTMERESLIKNAGYKLEVIWEADYKRDRANNPDPS